jgi:hypothetical protein
VVLERQGDIPGAGRRCFAAAVVAFVTALAVAEDGGRTVAAGEGGPGPESTLPASVQRGTDPKPRILGGFSARTRSRLAVSFQLAVGRLQTLPACAELFAELGCDGVARLRSVRYQTVSDVGGDRVCGRGLGAAAFTTVGNLRTIVCPGFDRLGVDEAAVIVLHEALHAAGRTEWPLDPSAPNGGQINRLIRMACKL